ncbi:hypothetical protein B0J13DRAFT_16198 [Dactylonectria estremocensis]|uniref:CCHC-type domain-containing protein n=1 Tax=Dactylonectria estremocensis TaxID=1079267 RepID=A0A9P9FI35_9HYPO|nr:hypothetical protein B0J13DRAFT_16198 [Dactylonectria estremocensis]
MAPETPRGVSSRLLTMKFMQRAVASASPAGSPDSESHSAKKRKLGESPSEGRMSLNIDQATIKAALDEQEAKRLAALEKHVGADTHWVLNNTWAGSKATTTSTPLKVVYVGYGDIDSSNESGDNEDVSANGRTSTHNFKKSKPKNPEPQKPAVESHDSSDSDSDVSDEPTPGRKRKPSSDSPHSQSARSRSRSRSQPRQSLEHAKAKEFREKRKKKEVKLSKVTSISSGGGNQFSPSSNKSMTCYRCHQTGHRAVDCPSSGGSRGRPKK